MKNTYKRTHRWDRILRDQDELELLQREDKLLHVLFSSIPDDCGLYDKPMARNVQIWTADGALLLDGPSASPEQLKQAMRHRGRPAACSAIAFSFPPCASGQHEVYWQRPLAGLPLPGNQSTEAAERRASGLPDGICDDTRRNRNGSSRLVPPTAFRTRHWKTRWNFGRVCSADRCRWLHCRSTTSRAKARATRATYASSLKLFNFEATGRLPRSLACHLLTLARHETLEQWLDSLGDANLVTSLGELIEPDSAPLPRRGASKTPASLTLARTARRTFEVDYWKTIALLAEGRFLNKNNADCVRDAVTQSQLPYHGRHLDPLAAYLLKYYGKRIAACGLAGQAVRGAPPLPLANGFRFLLDGWLALEPRSAR